ncbi:MAG: class I SAM-dependent methyltransferase [Alphaproteobacteria bacterium]|nr:class I SAM-dependent methyltransferase [Alphaproteobacteria bacterium]
MSRLDSAIRRLQAQRACLDWAVGEIAGRPGPVLELGLGNGRTYDHLRARLGEREIFVFERKVAAHPDCVPDEGHLLLGDFNDTLPGALARIGARAVFAHCDIGSGDTALTAALAAFVGPALAPLLAPGAVVAADQALAIPGFATVALPEGVAAGRYHLYRNGPN